MARPEPHQGTIPELTLGKLIAYWMHQHLVVPDGDTAGDPFMPTVDHRVYLANFYEVVPTAKPTDRNMAFRYQHGLWIAAQKVGKSPGIAAEAIVEFVGPVLFDGWAMGGEVYRCSEHKCPCGWEYEYEPGEPMGRPFSTPRIQLAALNEDQVENTWSALVPMIENGVLNEVLKVNEDTVKHPSKNRNAVIEVVTSKANTKLGARITRGMCDEIGLWTDANKMKKFYRTMARGAAGMGGRMGSSTNCYDPAEDSQAQTLHESKQKNVYKHYFPPDPKLDFKKKRDRRKIFAFNYRFSPWVSIDSIEAEAAGAMEANAAEAERFFGNRIVAGTGAWMPSGKWEERKAQFTVQPRTKVTAGFDGSETNDMSGIRLETLDFQQFTPRYLGGERETIWDPREWNDRIPRNEVHRAWEDIFNQFHVVRAYCDPFKFETELDEWKAKYGESVFIEWRTNRPMQMHAALERMLTDVVEPDSTFTHDGCTTTAFHMRNAVKAARPGQRYIIQKSSEMQKIDLAMSSVLAHEAAADAVANGDRHEEETSYAWI